MAAPRVAPLKRPSVISATSLSRPWPASMEVVASISGMPGAPLGPSLRMTITEPERYLAGGDRRHRGGLAVEHLGGAAVAQHLVGDRALLDHGAGRRQVAEQHGEAAGGMPGPRQRTNDLVVGDAGAGDGFADGAARHRARRAVHEAGVDQALDDRLDAAGVVELSMWCSPEGAILQMWGTERRRR